MGGLLGDSADSGGGSSPVLHSSPYARSPLTVRAMQGSSSSSRASACILLGSRIGNRLAEFYSPFLSEVRA
jgi:hypothetical protein